MFEMERVSVEMNFATGHQTPTPSVARAFLVRQIAVPLSDQSVKTCSTFVTTADDPIHGAAPAWNVAATNVSMATILVPIVVSTVNLA